MYPERVMHNHTSAHFVHIEIKTTAFFYISSHFSTEPQYVRARANKSYQAITHL